MNRIIFTICLGWLTCVPNGVMAAEKTPDRYKDDAAIVLVNPGNIVSTYAEFKSAVEQTMLTIPADKHFVLTDIQGMASVEIKEGDVTKIKVQLGYSPDINSRLQNSITFQTGIVFRPGTKVVVYPFPFGMGLDSSYGYITLAGYFY